MGSYYNQETGELSIWLKDAGIMGPPVRVRYADKDKKPGETPWYPRPEFFPQFHKQIMDAFKEAKIESKSDLYLVENEFGAGHLVWIFGRRDAVNQRGMQFQIDDIGAAAQFNQSPEELKSYVLRELKTLDAKKLGE